MNLYLVRLCTRSVIVAYALLMVKPAMPLITGSMAHAFWANAYIATVHKNNGKEHVHYELKKAAIEKGHGASGTKAKTQAEQELHTMPAPIAMRMPRPALMQTQWASYICYFAAQDIVPDYPPPKA